MQPRIEKYAVKRFVGLTTVLRESATAPNRYDGIAPLWAAFRARMESIPNRVGTDRFALIDGDFLEKGSRATYSSLVEVHSFEGVPADLQQFEFNEPQLAIFDGSGPISSINQLAHRVRLEWVPQTEHEVSANRELFVFSESYLPTDPDGKFQFALFV